VRRLRFLKTGKKTEGPVQFSLRADFSKPPLSEATITVPGDDVFAALMVLAKCLVPKGSLVIENVGLEAWNTQALQLLKTMGGTVGTNETGISSFGPMGTVIVQKTNAFGRKIECRPWWQFAAQLPTMAVMAAFAQGQSIFRGLEDPREDEPDGLARIIGCLAALGVRYGEMPDGIVIEGSKQFVGFDINVALRQLPGLSRCPRLNAGAHRRSPMTISSNTGPISRMRFIPYAILKNRPRHGCHKKLRHSRL
jgi:5-enolpyruvylshikimate-3-phosphate synthase